MGWEFEAGSLPDEGVGEAFRTFGFVVVRGVLDRPALTRVRSELDRVFGSAPLSGAAIMCNTELLKHEPIWRCLFNDAVVRSLRSALGAELCYQNDLDVQRNSYGQASLERHRGWHMDAGSESRNSYLRSSAYRFAKCGIFLQDFDNGWGGGIMIKPKSHRSFCEGNRLKRLWFRLRRTLDLVAIRSATGFDTFEVPTRAGDLCFFDSRLLHSSVLPSTDNIRKIGYDRKRDITAFWPDVPGEYTKYVIYWDACNRAMIDDFFRNSMGRSELETGAEKQRPPVFTRILALRYPEDYPAEFVTSAHTHNISVATLSNEQAASYKQKLRALQ